MGPVGFSFRQIDSSILKLKHKSGFGFFQKTEYLSVVSHEISCPKLESSNSSQFRKAAGELLYTSNLVSEIMTTHLRFNRRFRPPPKAQPACYGGDTQREKMGVSCGSLCATSRLPACLTAHGVLRYREMFRHDIPQMREELSAGRFDELCTKRNLSNPPNSSSCVCSAALPGSNTKKGDFFTTFPQLGCLTQLVGSVCSARVPDERKRILQRLDSNNLPWTPRFYLQPTPELKEWKRNYRRESEGSFCATSQQLGWVTACGLAITVKYFARTHNVFLAVCTRSVPFLPRRDVYQ